MSNDTSLGNNLYALLIGIDCYLPTESSGKPNPMNLGGCVRDINRVEKFLSERINLPANQLLKLTSSNTGAALPSEPPESRPTRKNIVSAFEWLGNVASPGDQLYIHYSGHGARVKTPARFQHEKRGDGFDEALVPCDFNYEQDNFLRDFELAYLLRRYVERKLVVTIVLDSCHSGGATRAGLRLSATSRTGVRSIGKVPQTLPPPETSVAPDDELKAVLKSQSQMPGRDFAVENGWLLEPQGYLLLAACRPSEFAYEHSFQGAELSGVLTHWLIDSLERMGPGVPFKTLYDRILAKVQSDFKNQTPQLQGETDRLAFRSDRAQSSKTVTVLQSEKDEVELNVGQAQGISVNAQFAIFAAGEFDLSAARRRALVRITTRGATSSRATVIEHFTDHPIEAGDQALLLESESSQAARSFRIAAGNGDLQAGGPLADLQPALIQSKTSLVQLATSEMVAEFTVSTNRSNEYVIGDADNAPISNLRAGPKTDVLSAPNVLIQRLIHLAKYLNVRDLSARDPYSPLWRKLTVTLLGVQTNYLMGDTPAPLPFSTVSGIPKVRVGDWTFVRIQNGSTQVLNITVLDLRPNWSIRQIYPAGSALYEPVDPGGSLTLPIRAGLPEGIDEGQDMIKVFATSGPSNFRWLELSEPEPNGDSPKIAWRGAGTTESDYSIRAIIEQSLGRRDFNFGIEDTASHEWTCAQVGIETERCTTEVPPVPG